uniref:Uncharacterized protein n=1 Tax=Oryza meridionalis TaxID=40149 RepID=A0A0E0BWH6_9ORYZ
MGDGGEKKVGEAAAAAAEGWRLSVNDFQLPERPKDPHFVKRVIKRCHGRRQVGRRPAGRRGEAGEEVRQPPAAARDKGRAAAAGARGEAKGEHGEARLPVCPDAVAARRRGCGRGCRRRGRAGQRRWGGVGRRQQWARSWAVEAMCPAAPVLQHPLGGGGGARHQPQHVDGQPRGESEHSEQGARHGGHRQPVLGEGQPPLGALAQALQEEERPLGDVAVGVEEEHVILPYLKNHRSMLRRS